MRFVSAAADVIGFVRLNGPNEAALDPMRSNRLYETDSFFLPIPGSKLPGYDR
jgi:hypothetical protein